jgi:hypothetical protein
MVSPYLSPNRDRKQLAMAEMRAAILQGQRTDQTRTPVKTRSERFLIVNADDFGMSDSVNRGIVDSHTEGVVTSASLLAHGRRGVPFVFRRNTLP